MELGERRRGGRGITESLLAEEGGGGEVGEGRIERRGRGWVDWPSRGHEGRGRSQRSGSAWFDCGS